MAIERWRPFGTLMDRDPFRDIQHEMNRLFDRFLGRPLAPASGMDRQPWVPILDMYETSDDLIVNFELPGVREKDISLSVTGDLLTVKGEREFNHQLGDDNSLHTERVYGKFERSIRLPMPVQADRVSATYRDGMLEVRLPKTDEVRPKEIKIEVL
jgi:HSP20 family protein